MKILKISSHTQLGYLLQLFVTSLLTLNSFALHSSEAENKIISSITLKEGSTPPQIILKNDLGHKVSDGSEWNSEELKGRVYTLVYVDPDEKDTNPEMEESIKKEDFSRDRYGSIAIINLAATWKPNFIIESLLKEKQKQFPLTLYVKDFKKVLVKEWGLKDDAYNVLTFDKEGKLLFQKAGKLSTDETKKLIEIIKRNI